MALPDPNALYTLKNGVCERDLNETRLTSAADCPLTRAQVWACVADQDDCADDHLFRDIHLVLLAVIVLLLGLRFRDRFTKRPAQQDRYRKLRYIRKGSA